MNDKKKETKPLSPAPPKAPQIPGDRWEKNDKTPIIIK